MNNREYSASGEPYQYGLFDDRENPLFQNPTVVIICYCFFIYMYIKKWVRGTITAFYSLMCIFWE